MFHTLKVPTYAEDIALAVFIPANNFFPINQIKYYDWIIGQWHTQRASIDPKFDCRQYDCLLLNNMAAAYYNIAHHAIHSLFDKWDYTELDQALTTSEQALILLKDSIDALSEKGSMRKELKPFAPFSMEVAGLAADCILMSLQYIGYEKLESTNVPEGTEKLCQQLTKIAGLVKRKYEVIIYND